MNDWQELEQRFRALETALKGARLDFNYDDHGRADFWLVGGPAPDEASFQALSDIAGAQLAAVSRDHLPDEVAAATDNRFRWYWALWRMVGPHQQPAVGWEHGPDGSIARTLTIGQIHTPAAFSSALALRLQALTFTRAAVSPLAPQPGAIMKFLGREAAQRGLLWTVIAGFVGLVLAWLAIV